MTAAGNALIEDDGPRNAQAIVVLGGDDFGTRILKAAQLAESGCAPLVLVSGPPKLMGYEADETIRYAVTKGYPASLFRPLHLNTDSTRSETRAIGAYLREHGIRKIVLVTSNFHTRRAAKLMRQVNPDINTGVIPAADPFFTPNTWWQSRNGARTFLYEWMKTIATDLGI
ncbi:MAG: YdcF family protein [Acidobacteriaceae bacterium]|nr:YdcF family protein [Acidobacteriaceae bacterium]